MCEEMIKNPYRRVWACVNLDALHDNLRQIAACRKNDAGIIAVIKADGYGHGAVMLAREMDEIPEVIGYAVATEEEAVLLADAGIKSPRWCSAIPFQRLMRKWHFGVSMRRFSPIRCWRI